MEETDGHIYTEARNHRTYITYRWKKPTGEGTKSGVFQTDQP